MSINEDTYRRITSALLEAGYAYEEKGLRSGDSASVWTSSNPIRCIRGVRFSGEGLVFNMFDSKKEIFNLLSMLDKGVDSFLFYQNSFDEFNSEIKPFSGSVLQNMIRGGN